MMAIGAQLFGLGVLPDYTGVEMPDIHRDGTSGNLAVRIPGTESSHAAFVVTRRGGHKGRLRPDDFVVVRHVDWARRIIYYSSSRDQPPSTDSLLVARAFEAKPEFSAWIHVHFALETSFIVEMKYPTVEKSQWADFEGLVRSGVRVVNLRNHDLARHEPREEPDASIILGSNTYEVSELALNLVQKALMPTATNS